MSSELFDTVRQIIAMQLHMDEDAITEDSLIAEELGADSMDAVEMMMGLEDALGITIPEEEADSFRTPGDIVRYLEQVQQ